MNFDLSPDQEAMRDSVARFAGDGSVEARKATRMQPGGIDRTRWQALADLGLLALPLSTDAGGMGGDRVDCAVVAEALGRALAVEPWLECGYFTLQLTGDASIASGERLAAVAFAEPGRRYALEPQLRATQRGEGWALNGAKTFVLGGAADLFLVTASTLSGAAVFAVEAAATDRRNYVVVDGSLAAEIVLRDTPGTRLPADFTAAVTATRLMAAAEMVGLASRLFDDTVAYVKQRMQFGQPLGSFQVIQHRLVDAYATLEQMRSTLWRTVLGEPSAAQVAGAKALIAEGALAIGHEAIQLHGGMGVTDELTIGHGHKRILLLSKLFGDPASGFTAYAEAA